VLLLDRAELADKLPDLRDRLGRVPLLVLGVDALGRLVEDGSNHGKVLIAQAAVQRVRAKETDLALVLLPGDCGVELDKGVDDAIDLVDEPLVRELGKQGCNKILLFFHLVRNTEK